MSNEFKDLAAIDRLVHEPARLSILAVLKGVEEADFFFLLDQTALTKGNLSSHVGKLEAAAYVKVKKAFVGKIPRTVYRLTPKGEAALRRYREHLSAAFTAMSP